MYIPIRRYVTLMHLLVYVHTARMPYMVYTQGCSSFLPVIMGPYCWNDSAQNVTN